MRYDRPSLLLLLATLAWPGVAKAGPWKRTGLPGQVLEIHTDIAGFAQEQGLRQGDLGLVQTLDLGVPPSWSGGLIGPAARKNFYLSPVEVKGAPGTLHVIYGGATAKLSAEECDGAYPGAVCKPAQLKVTGAVAQLTAGASTWELELMGNPCASGPSCDFYVPSWALANRAANPGQGDAPFPRLVTAVEVKGRGLCFLSTETGATYLCVNYADSKDLQDLGALRRVEADAVGLIVLRFTGGALALDFALDRVWLLKPDAVAVASGGIARAGESTYRHTFDHVGAGAVKAVTVDTVVWEHGVLPGWQVTSASPPAFVANPGTVALAETVDAGSGGASSISAVMSVEDEWQLATYDATGWTVRDRVAATGSDVPRGLAFTATAFMIPDLQGAYHLASGKQAAVSLPGAAAVVRLLADGSAFVKSAQAPCRIVHFQQTPGDPAAFGESGLSLPCAPVVTYGVATDRVVVTVRHAFAVTSYVLAH